MDLKVTFLFKLTNKKLLDRSNKKDEAGKIKAEISLTPGEKEFLCIKRKDLDDLWSKSYSMTWTTHPNADSPLLCSYSLLKYLKNSGEDKQYEDFMVRKATQYNHTLHLVTNTSDKW